nr:DUF4133 domain-containing protein [uncultured Dyadobacter sp.]
MAKIYPINKGINRSIIFRGLKAQYIWYMAATMLGQLIFYALMYLAGINTYVCLVVTIFLATISMIGVYHLSTTYGEHGLLKALAARRIPKVIKATSRSKFINPKTRNGAPA